MGVETAVMAAGALAGLGLSALSKPKTPNMSASYTNSGMMPTPPPTPNAVVPDGEQKSASIMAAEDEERRKRAAEAAANQTSVTGGLGVTDPAQVQRKTLLGG